MHWAFWVISIRMRACFRGCPLSEIVLGFFGWFFWEQKKKKGGFFDSCFKTCQKEIIFWSSFITRHFVSPGKPETCSLWAASPNQYDKNFLTFCFTLNTGLDTKYSRAHGACFCEGLMVLEILNAMNLRGS